MNDDQIFIQTPFIDYTKLFTDFFFMHAYKVFQSNSRNYMRTKNKLNKMYPFLTSFSLAHFKKMCKSIFPFIRADPLYYQRTSSSATYSFLLRWQREFQPQLQTNESLYREPSPENPARKGNWDPREVEQLVNAYTSNEYKTKHGVQWGYLSQNIPGKSGIQCYQKIQKMIAKGEIQTETDPEYDPTMTNL